MRKWMWMAVAAVTACSAARGPQTRPAAVAGSFYPGEAGALTRMMDGYLAQAKPPKLDGTLMALVSPHAGYDFSGPVAAYGYSLLKGHKYKRVVVIGPTHVESFNFTSVYDGDAYKTPLGSIAVDKEFVARLVATKAARLSSKGHAISGERGEHSIEVQLPWLQHMLGEFKLVPVVMGDQSYEASRALGVALAKLIDGSADTLIVASSDLSHYYPYTQAMVMDAGTLRAVVAWDYLAMWRNFEQRAWEACGGAPIIATLMATERMGARQARVLKYANSGDITGDKTRVVGYGSVAIVKSNEQSEAERPFTLGEKEKAALLALARHSVETAVRERKMVQLGPPELPALAAERGAFVTLKENGELRGCIGQVAASKALMITVRDVAAWAALKDTRFAPVKANELAKLEYEISVLSPLRRVADVNQIQVGRDGLLIKRGEEEGLLLPQVPVEQKWDRATFLEQTCRKAGLPTDAWKDPQTDIFAFTALVFGEHTKQ